jgi:hypothetical protein
LDGLFRLIHFHFDRKQTSFNKHLEEQKKFYQKIITGSNIPGDQAIAMAREMKGQPATQTLKISYTTKEELIRKLEKKLRELKGNS